MCCVCRYVWCVCVCEREREGWKGGNYYLIAVAMLQAQAHALSKKQADRLTAAQRRVARETVCVPDVFSE